MSTLAFGMSEVTRLTRAGRLMEATALIQNGLGGHGRKAESAREPAFGRLPAPGASSRTAMPEAPRRREILEAPPPLPGQASFETKTIRNAAGIMRFKLYVPSTSAAEPCPLVVMLHGCTQSPDDFAAGTRMNEWAERYGFLVAYPEQTRAANPLRCWNWFKSGDQVRDRGEPSLIADATRRVLADHPADPDWVFIAGLSAGGAAAAIMGCAYPDLYAGVGVHSGLACGAASDMTSAFAAMRGGTRAGSSRMSRVPTIVFHGTADKTVAPANARAVAEQVACDDGSTETLRSLANGVPFTRIVRRNADSEIVLEQWMIDGAGHAWSGGSSAGSYTDPRGPDASREMLRFFGIAPTFE